MARVYQVAGDGVLVGDGVELSPASDLFIQVRGGTTIRVNVKDDGVVIAPINGIRMSIAPVTGGGAHGIKFSKG